MLETTVTLKVKEKLSLCWSTRAWKQYGGGATSQVPQIPNLSTRKASLASHCTARNDHPDAIR